jgi:putative phosphoribosyl transferase
MAAAAAFGERISAVVSRGGRPDLVEDKLPAVKAATLLAVGGNDPVVQDRNEKAFAKLTDRRKLVIVPGASHLFEDPGKLEEVAKLAAEWFETHINKA